MAPNPSQDHEIWCNSRNMGVTASYCNCRSVPPFISNATGHIPDYERQTIEELENEIKKLKREKGSLQQEIFALRNRANRAK